MSKKTQSPRRKRCSVCGQLRDPATLDDQKRCHTCRKKVKSVQQTFDIQPKSARDEVAAKIVKANEREAAKQPADPTKSPTGKLINTFGKSTVTKTSSTETTTDELKRQIEDHQDGIQRYPEVAVTSLLSQRIKQEKEVTTGVLPPHVIVEARAGTGKTTTLVEGLKRVKGLPSTLTPSPQQAAVWEQMELSRDAKTVCFVAFNKAIAEELKRRVPQGCEASTMHSMGFKAVGRAFSGLRVNSYRVQDIISELLERDIRELRRTKPEVIKATEELVGLCKINLAHRDSCGSNLSVGDPDWQEVLADLASYYDVDLNGNSREVFDLVPRILERCKQVDQDKCLDFNDMIWLPIALNLPVFQYDLLLVDECFPAGTMVETNHGSVPIEQIAYQPNRQWQVLSTLNGGRTLGYNRVTSAYRTLRNGPLVRIKHAKGELYCTANHPLWIEGKGWTPAGMVSSGDALSCLRKAYEAGKKDLLFNRMQVKDEELELETASLVNGSRDCSPSQDCQADERSTQGNTQPSGPPRSASQNLSHTQSSGQYLHHSWRQWQDCSLPDVIISSGSSTPASLALEPRICRLQWTRSKVQRLSDQLQDRYSFFDEAGSNRSGRQFSSQQKCQDQGYEEGRHATISRVVSVEVYEPTSQKRREGGCPQDNQYVYTLSVESGAYFADGVLVKNCQDLNRAQQELAKRAGKRLVFCGDPKQAIYGFAGADAESMARLERDLSATEQGCIHLPLTVTRRCGKAIVREAQKYVPDFEAFETNPEGSIDRMKFKPDQTQKTSDGKLPLEAQGYQGMVQTGDMILCRCNAPLVSECFRFIRAGRKANIQGRDVGQGLINTIKKMKSCRGLEESQFSGVPVPCLISDLDDWLHSEMNKENAKRNPSDSRLINLQDKRDCLGCFCDMESTVGGVLQRITAVFTDDKNGSGIRLSSVHKAKGLESRRVFILMPKEAPMPHPMAKSAWEKGQEINILYVAITRAIEELIYVS